MNTGFKNLDKIVNLGKAEIILITGTNVDILSGDIANNICLNQGYEVLEVVSHKKEYLIKRLLVNQRNVESLAILDVFPLNAGHLDRGKYRKNVVRIFKDMNKISKKLNIHIIIAYDIDIKKKYNSETYQAQYITKQVIVLKKQNYLQNQKIIIYKKDFVIE